MKELGRRRTVNPNNNDGNPKDPIRQHAVDTTNAQNLLVSEYNVEHKEKPIPFWLRDLKIPRWLLALFFSLIIIIFTAFALFAAIVTLKKETNGGACQSNSDCRQDLGLICNNYRCGCAYSHFWSDSYEICERRRMINRTCYNDSQCDALASLICVNVTLVTGDIQAQCQCKAGMAWSSYGCGAQGLYNATCNTDLDCDSTRFLYCNLVTYTCLCNTSMFWNGNSISGTCEYKRTINQYCYPYDNNWCDDTGPIGQGLTCASYVNPYGSEYGVCQCGTHQYYNGSSLLGNGYCVAQKAYNYSCTTVLECDYRVNLTCTNNLCLCASGQNYNPPPANSGYGNCVGAAGYLQNCSATFACSSSQNLYCDYTYYSSNITGVCNCNSSWSYWDGTTCAKKLSIGGQCSNDSQCITSDGLFCSNYTQSSGQCDCDLNHFWNYTCISKQFYNTTCPTSYVCDDNRGLQCQGLGGIMFQKCDCYNSSYIWDSLYINRTYSCIPRLGNNQTTCYGDLECEVFNYLICDNGTCQCAYTDYWDGSRCQPKRNYTDLCNYTYWCRDFSPVNLVCRYGTTVPPVLQCLCNTSSYWDVCLQECVTTKKLHEQCKLSGNCTSIECDITANLQCINDSSTFSIGNITGTGIGWCNCTTLQWWNGTYCRNKGTPSWGVNASDICNATYQCADYNLVSCPLGGNFPTINSTCECATTKYWNGLTCLDRVVYGQSCTLWPINPVNTSTCLTAAGAGLLCNSSTCFGGTNCTGGVCYCPTNTVWNSTFLICASTGSTG